MKSPKLYAVVFLAAAAASAPAALAGPPVEPKPEIAGFQPTSGPPGSEVELTGANFSSQYTVWLGATQVEVLSAAATSIKVKLPGNAKSGHFVLKGKYIVESKGLFTVVEKKPAPRIDGFSPASGPPGTQVAIAGANFSVQPFENGVMLGNQQIQVQSATPTQITVIIPKGAITGAFSVTVAGAGAATSASAFTVLTVLEIADVTPVEGPPGTVVTLLGSGFGDSAKQVAVTLGGKKVKVLAVAPDKVTVEVPPDAISAPFLLAKGTGKVQSKASFTVKIPPAISSVSPLEGFPGTVVTIAGAHFGGSELMTKVKIGAALMKILSITDEKIEVQVPAAAPSGQIAVEIADKGTALSSSPFAVWEPLAIASFAPEKGEEGAIVTIAGKGFVADVGSVTVSIGGKPQAITAITPTQISVKVGAGSATGIVSVAVAKRGTVETAKQFTVIRPPVIGGFSPPAGMVGQTLTVTGASFGFSTDNIRVWIGPEATKQFCIVNQLADTKLACQVQPGTPSGPVTVQVKEMGKAVSATPFTVEEPLAVTGFSPPSGMPGTAVTITGTGFSPDAAKNAVKMGKLPLAVVSATAHELVVQVPETLKGDAPFAVTVKGRTGSAISAAPFVLIIPVKVAKMTPKAGPVGTVVTLAGQGFGADPQMVQVTLLGFYCVIVEVKPALLKVQIPPGLIPDQSEGKFQVVANPGGIAESPAPFKVTSKGPKGKK